MKNLLISMLSLAFGLGVANAQDAAVAKPDVARGQAIVTQVCAACHGADGNSAVPTYPKLAQQHADYLIKQLHNFKLKPGATAAERPNPVMAAFAAQLNDADIMNVAAYLSQQQEKPGIAQGTKESVELGQRIYHGGIVSKGVPACQGCHGPTGAGIPAQYPRLSGQWADYTAAQLTAFRDGVRHNSQPMAQIAAKLSDQEMKAVADYIAGLH